MAVFAGLRVICILCAIAPALGAAARRMLRWLIVLTRGRRDPVYCENLHRVMDLFGLASQAPAMARAWRRVAAMPFSLRNWNALARSWVLPDVERATCALSFVIAALGIGHIARWLL